jgi:hypothetical protein
MYQISAAILGIRHQAQEPLIDQLHHDQAHGLMRYRPAGR